MGKSYRAVPLVEGSLFRRFVPFSKGRDADSGSTEVLLSSHHTVRGTVGSQHDGPTRECHHVGSVLFHSGVHDQADESIFSCRHIGNLYDIVLRLGQLTIFNTLFELQQFASSLAYNQVAEPQVYVDPTYQWISIRDQTLYLQNLRDGMQKLVQTAKDIYLRLSGDDTWEGLPKGLKVVDDLSNTHRGYSFLEEQPFWSQRHAFFLSLVERRRLGTVMADGSWAWDHVAVREFLDSADRLWGHVIHALYVGVHLSTRVTQFLQHQIRNADRPRNLFFQGEEGFFFTRYSKTTHLKGRDSCVPAFLSDPLRELLLVLLGGGLREAQAVLAGVEYGEEARWLYRT